jgi:hypothetical protein
MPLRDHFRSPVNDTHSWDELHGQWPGEIVRHLTTILPAGFLSGHRSKWTSVPVTSTPATRTPTRLPGAAARRR